MTVGVPGPRPGHQVGGHLVHELGDGGEGEGVLDVVVVERHVPAHHQRDRQVRRAPSRREEGALVRSQPLGLAEDGEVGEPQVERGGEGPQGAGGGSVLTHLQRQQQLKLE